MKLKPVTVRRWEKFTNTWKLSNTLLNKPLNQRGNQNKIEKKNLETKANENCGIQQNKFIVIIF